LKHNYFELRRIKPRLKRLKELLEESTYAGDQYESEKAGRKVRYIMFRAAMKRLSGLSLP